MSELTENEMVILWNNYCDENYSSHSYIFYMYEFDDLFSGRTPLEIAEIIIDSEGELDIHDEYFRENVYGLESFDSIDTDVIEDAIDWIKETAVSEYDPDSDGDDFDKYIDKVVKRYL